MLPDASVHFPFAEASYSAFFLGNPEFGVDLQPINFAEYARAAGGVGFRLEDPHHAAHTVEQFLATPGPAILDAIIDPAKHVVTHKVKFSVPGLRQESIQAVGIALTRDGKTGFVALGPANRIAVVDAATHQVTKYLLVGQRVWHMAFTPDEKYLLTTNGVSNDVSVIDVAALKVMKTIQVGELPWGVTISQQ